MPMYNLTEYSNNYSKTSESLMQYCKDEPSNNITDSESFKFTSKFLHNTNNAGIIDAKIAVLLLYFSNFWRPLEMPLINCEIKLILTWSANCVISEGNGVTTFAKTDTKDTKLYVSVVTLSIQDNTKLLQQLKSGFKRTGIKWNKYQSKATTQNQNQYLGYLIHPSFQRVNRIFVLSLKIMHTEQDAKGIFSESKNKRL